jgi:SAM-dependent methyltransferase
VQYLPGHVEPFVDLVISEYLPDDGEILDLGGGGLRFALPVALLGRRVTVVDVDPIGLDVEMVVQRVNENERSELEPEAIASMLEMIEADVLDFLRTIKRQFGLVTAFRVVHFLEVEQILEMARLVNGVLRPDGIFAFSAMTPFNLPEGGEFNEVFVNSEPVSAQSQLHRKFRDDPGAKSVRKDQNLGECVHLVDSEFAAELARRSGFDIVAAGVRSTRIVAGYVFRRMNGGSENTLSR